jgi:glycosyltransferase involved in cell wall biosynthesis
MAATGHEFVSLGMVWPDNERSRPPNWHLTEKYECAFDAAIAFSEDGLRRIIPLGVPTVYANFMDMSQGQVPDWVENAADLLVYTNWDTARRWTCRDESKRRIIEFGVDDSLFDRTDPREDVMTVGNFITERADKGPAVLKAVDNIIDIHTYGVGNECLRGAKGFRPYAVMERIYGDYKIYFNPGPVICGSVAEAMCAGLAIVTMTPMTYTDLIEDCVDGFVAKNTEEALSVINKLLENKSLREKVARRGMATARRRFDMDRHVKDWNTTLEEIVAIKATA